MFSTAAVQVVGALGISTLIALSLVDITGIIGAGVVSVVGKKKKKILQPKNQKNSISFLFYFQV